MTISVKLDITKLLAGFDRYCQLQYIGTEVGLDDVAEIAQNDMKETVAHGDVTGATRASYRAFVIGGEHTGASEASSGYAAAAQELATHRKHGLSGHGGQALSQDSGITLTPEQRGVIYTSYTDYQVKLETENSAKKAVLGPEVTQTMDLAIKLVADAIKEVL
jgi:hypothetical protein